MDNGLTVAVDTAFAASVRVPQRVLLMGSGGALELVNELRVVLRQPGKEEEIFDFPPPPGDIHEPALTPYLADVIAALRSGKQIAPNFDDGVAMAEAIDRLRAGPIA